MGFDIKCGACGKAWNCATIEATFASLKEHQLEHQPPAPPPDDGKPIVTVNDQEDGSYG